MTTTRNLLWTLPVTAALGVGAWFILTPEPSPPTRPKVSQRASTPLAAPAPTDPDRAPGCAFTQGERLAYRLELSSTMHLDALQQQGNTRDSRGDIASTTRATLELEAIGESSPGVVLARLTELTSTALVSDAQLEAPFLLHINADCQIEGFAQHRDTPAGHARLQQTLAHELMWTWPSLDARLQGRHGLGEFTASIAGDGERADYTLSTFSPWRTGRHELTQLESGTMTVYPGSRGWFERLESRSSYAGDQTSASFRTLATATSPGHAALDDAPRDLATYIWTDLLSQDIELEQKTGPSESELLARKRVEHFTLDQALERHIARVSTQDVGIHETWPELSTWLEVHPEATEDLVNRMKTHDVPAEATMTVYIAMGNARTPEARKSLEGIMRDDTAPIIERSRAILSLIDRDDVGVELAQYLQTKANVLGTTTSQASHVMARQSLLALGAMSGRKPQDEELREIAMRTAQQVLKETDGQGFLLQRPAFGALANIGHPEALALFTDMPNHPDRHTREAAAVIFRRMSIKDSAPLLDRWLADERDPNVLRALWSNVELATYDRGEALPEQLLVHAVRDLDKRPGPITKKALIRVIGRAVETMEGDRLGIQALFSELLIESLVASDGLHLLFYEYIEPSRREALYLEAGKRMGNADEMTQGNPGVDPQVDPPVVSINPQGQGGVQ